MQKRKTGKYAAALILTISIAALAAGCAKKTDPAGTSQPQGETGTSQAVDMTEESTEDPRTMPELKSEDEINILCGTVKDAGMNTLVVANEEYPDGVVFAKEDAAVSLTGGLAIDHEVTVFYRGEIKLEDSKSVHAELVRDPREGDKDCLAGVVSGEVLGVGMSVITIRTEEGTEVSFDQDPKPVNLAAGPVEGDDVTIFYSHKQGETIYIPELIQDKEK